MSAHRARRGRRGLSGLRLVKEVSNARIRHLGVATPVRRHLHLVRSGVGPAASVQLPIRDLIHLWLTRLFDAPTAEDYAAASPGLNYPEQHETPVAKTGVPAVTHPR